MSIKPEEVKETFTSLQKPLKLNNDLTLRNRLVMASLTRSRGVPEDYVNKHVVDYYRQRAGAGLILSEGTLISPQGSEWLNVVSIYSEEHAKKWKLATDAVHKEGGSMFAQLWHVGRIAHPYMPLQKKFGKPVSAPSPIAAKGPGPFRLLDDPNYLPPAREHPDPEELVEEFRAAAKLAKKAGFDGVELHGANGYLVNQFLDKGTNVRTDKWGGSLENRLRFFKECIDALVEVWGADHVGLKANPAGGYNDVGMSEEDTIETFSAVVRYCVEKGLAYVQLVRYLPFMDAGTGDEGDKKRAKTHLDVLEVFEPLIHTPNSKTKLFLNGDLGAVEADKLIEAGKIDVAVLGRSFIGNPDLPRRLFEHLPLNEDLGAPLDPKRFYSFLTKPSEGYSDYPMYEEAKKAHEEKKASGDKEQS